MIRFCDIIISLIALLFFIPLFLFVIVLIIIESDGGAFYKQVRVGRNGKDFYLFKFRSMRVGSDKKSLITVGNRDSRITNVGYFIRKYKIDELPQLLNVLKGDMSLVGPRPEVRRYVDLYTDEQKIVLSIKPGITDLASIQYIDENEILSKAENPNEVYINKILPEKIKCNLKYINNRNITQYLQIIIKTIMKIIINK